MNKGRYLFLGFIVGICTITTGMSGMATFRVENIHSNVTLRVTFTDTAAHGATVQTIVGPRSMRATVLRTGQRFGEGLPAQVAAVQLPVQANHLVRIDVDNNVGERFFSVTVGGGELLNATRIVISPFTRMTLFLSDGSESVLWDSSNVNI